MFNIFSSNKIFTCSKHNYTGINSPCPDCGLVEAGVMQKITEANKIALAIAESVTPKLTEQEQAFFIVGFVECAKLNSNFTA